MSGTSDSVGTVDPPLAQAERLLTTDPRLAVQRATEALGEAPGHPAATLLLGIAQRLAGDLKQSVDTLGALVQSMPDSATAHCELGRSLGAAGHPEASVAALQRALELQPTLPGAWSSLAGQLRELGDLAGAEAVCTERFRLSLRDPRLVEAQAAIQGGQLTAAESLLRRQLQEDPTDVAAMRMLAEVALKFERIVDARKLLERCLELAPGYGTARYQLAIALYRQGMYADALREIDQALAAEPRQPAFRNVRAVLLGRVGDLDRSIEVYADLLAEHPEQPRTWMSYGHALIAAGRQGDGIAAYRRSISLSPDLGEAWWSLANLKTFRFTAQEIDEMRHRLGRGDLSGDDRLHFEFALGRALEDAGDAAGSFAHYAAGNRQHRATLRYDSSKVTEHMRRSKALLTPQFFANRSGYGNPAPDPIFIVGMPRSGSTLLEQILSSHSAVEGTKELPDLIAIARDLNAGSGRLAGSAYLQVLADLTPEECHALGERYLASTRALRKAGRPMFIDKMPNNFAHAGLIHLILPNARIIDARRHPLACCFSSFSQHFARGQEFTYDLEELGHYYRDYVELMAHFDTVLPGRVHRVYYERLIEHTGPEVRRLLDYCGLPFEEACLRFHETARTITTASSEQVRQPIYRDALDHWRQFEGWLEPLKKALGPVLAAYPDVPPFTPGGMD